MDRPTTPYQAFLKEVDVLDRKKLAKLRIQLVIYRKMKPLYRKMDRLTHVDLTNLEDYIDSRLTDEC
jgi:hypothetical protein